MKKEDSPPQGLFASTMAGPASVPDSEGEAPAGDKAISQLFGDETVKAPSISDAAVNEADLSRLEAARKRDLLNDRWSSAPAPLDPAPATHAIPMGVVANDTPKPRAANLHKVTLLGAGVMAAPPPASLAPVPAPAPAGASRMDAPAELPAPPAAAARPSFAFDSTMLSLPMEPPSLAPPPTPIIVAKATPAPAAKSQPQPQAQKSRERISKPGAKAPPPPPAKDDAASAGTSNVTLAIAGAVLVIALAIGGALAGFYELPPRAAALLGLQRRSTAAAASVATVAPAIAAKPVVAAKAVALAPTPTPAPAEKPIAAVPAAAPPAVAAAPVTKPTPTVAAAAAAPAPKPVAVVVAAAPPATPAPTPAPAAKPAPVAPVAVPGPGDESVDGLIERSHAALEKHDFSDAESSARKALTLDTKAHHAMEMLALALIGEKRGADAIPFAEQIVAKRPKRAAYRVIEGDARRLAGDSVGAETAYRMGLALEPNNPELKKRLGL